MNVHRTVAGALYDFISTVGVYAVVREDGLVSYTDMKSALKAFADQRGLDLTAPDIGHWDEKLIDCPSCEVD